MNPAQLLTHFDRISDAPDAIPRLRRFILDLAVRGKLEEQNNKDEPASVLLKRILAEKIRRGRIDRVKRAEPTPLDDEPFPLPMGWTWASLADLVAVLNGRAYSQNELLSSGTPVLRVGNLFTSKHWYYSNLELEEDKYCSDGDLIFSWSASFGPFIWHGPKVIYHYHIWKLDLHNNHDLDKHYLYRFLLHKTQEIKESGHGVSMIHMTKEKMEKLKVPLPPLEEQHRIVSKVDELMALCDQLEAAQAERESRRDRLVASSLNRLNNDADPSVFRDHARFYFNHLPRLTTKPDHIQQLRQTILNLAVRGKLVPQDPNEESLHLALRVVLARRGMLVRTKKVRRKKLDDSAEIETQYDLPAAWSRERLGNLVDPENTISYGVLVPGNDVHDGVPFVRAQDLYLSNHPERPNKTISPDIERAYKRTRLRGGEILLCVVGSIGKLGVVPPSWAGANIARAVARILLVPEVSRDYLLVVLRSEPAQSYFTEATRTLAQPTLNVGLIEQTVIPLPPRAEQDRIVAKVDELMALCDKLDAQLTTTHTDSRRLLGAVLHEALTSTV